MVEWARGSEDGKPPHHWCDSDVYLIVNMSGDPHVSAKFTNVADAFSWIERNEPSWRSRGSQMAILKVPAIRCFDAST